MNPKEYTIYRRDTSKKSDLLQFAERQFFTGIEDTEIELTEAERMIEAELEFKPDRTTLIVTVRPHNLQTWFKNGIIKLANNDPVHSEIASSLSRDDELRRSGDLTFSIMPGQHLWIKRYKPDEEDYLRIAIYPGFNPSIMMNN